MEPEPGEQGEKRRKTGGGDERGARGREWGEGGGVG